MTVCPHNQISGGKKLRAKTRKSNSRAAKAFRLAAQSLAHDNSALGHFYRRMRAKFGPAKAITATAHKLARIAFHMVTTGEPNDESVFAKAERKHRSHQENRLKTNARKLGFELVPIQQSTENFAQPQQTGSLEAGMSRRHAGPKAALQARGLLHAARKPDCHLRVAPSPRFSRVYLIIGLSYNCRLWQNLDI
jgi:hypothetical protein